MLENGADEVLADSPSLATVLEAAKTSIRSRKPVGLAGRLVLGLGALRLAVEERLEPILAEAEELPVRVAPQLTPYV